MWQLHDDALTTRDIPTFTKRITHIAKDARIGISETVSPQDSNIQTVLFIIGSWLPFLTKMKTAKGH